MRNAHEVRENVRAGYAAIAQSGGTCGGETHSCCGASAPDSAVALAQSVGYAHEDLAHLPDGANMGLSCGNPTALASLQPGEVVLDLGSGGGFDVFIAGRKVGAEGHVFGVDMTPEMLSKARRNAITYRERTGLDNVEFRLGEIEHLPLPDASVDVVISNCVINLSPDKPQVWREIARVLKPGGRVAVSDLALVRPLPAELLHNIEALIGCVAGAVLIEDTARMAREAGFRDIVLERKAEYVDAMTSVNDPLYARLLELLPQGHKASDYVVSLNISALKPAEACCGAACCG